VRPPACTAPATSASTGGAPGTRSRPGSVRVEAVGSVWLRSPLVRGGWIGSSRITARSCPSRDGGRTEMAASWPSSLPSPAGAAHFCSRRGVTPNLCPPSAFSGRERTTGRCASGWRGPSTVSSPADGLTAIDGAMLEPLGVGIHHGGNLAHLRPGTSVGVFGWPGPSASSASRSRGRRGPPARRNRPREPSAPARAARDLGPRPSRRGRREAKAILRSVGPRPRRGDRGSGGAGRGRRGRRVGRPGDGSCSPASPPTSASASRSRAPDARA